MSSPHRSIAKSVLTSLLSDSGHLCAFPNCTSPNKLPDGTPLLEVVHIVSLSTAGLRSDLQMRSDELNAKSNLLLLCPSHHRWVDRNPAEFTVERLRVMRDQHFERVAKILASSNQLDTYLPAATSRLQQALVIWERERRNGSEEFWQNTFAGRPELFAGVTLGRAFTLDSKCYLGGKATTNQHGNVVDFLAQHHCDVAIIEIKTPMSKLLGAKYRGVYPPSRELGGAITQALNYRQSLLESLHNLRSASPGLTVHSPSVFVLIGDADREEWPGPQRRSFELFRNGLKDVIVQTYDELFNGIANLATLMEPPPVNR